MEKTHSKIGIASFIVAVIAAFLILCALVAAGILQHGHPPGKYPGQEIVGLSIIFLLFLDASAVVLGVVSVFEKERKRLFGVLGLCISCAAIFGSIVLLVVGMVVMMLKK